MAIPMVYHPRVVLTARWIYHLMLRIGPEHVLMRLKNRFRKHVPDQVIVTTPEGLALQGSLDHLGELSLVARGAYEAGTLSVFRASLRPGATVLDIGANLGVFAIAAGQEVGFGGRVIAVEPDERNLRHLRENIRRVSSDCVEVVPKAVSDVTGAARFHQADPPTCSSLLPAALDRSHRAGVVELPTITVDDLLAGRAVDVIKMDVEGAEWTALDGMTQTLEDNPGLVLIVECEDQTLRAAGSSAKALIGRLQSHFAKVLVVDEERQVLVHPSAWRMRLWQNLLCAPASFVPNLPVIGG